MTLSPAPDRNTGRITEERTYRLVFDTEQMRPGCVLLAAAFGADQAATHAFPADTWLVAPTDAMKVYRITDSQLAQLVRQVTDA